MAFKFDTRIPAHENKDDSVPQPMSPIVDSGNSGRQYQKIVVTICGLEDIVNQPRNDGKAVQEWIIAFVFCSL